MPMLIDRGIDKRSDYGPADFTKYFDVSPIRQRVPIDTTSPVLNLVDACRFGWVHPDIRSYTQNLPDPHDVPKGELVEAHLKVTDSIQLQEVKQIIECAADIMPAALRHLICAFRVSKDEPGFAAIFGYGAMGSVLTLPGSDNGYMPLVICGFRGSNAKLDVIDFATEVTRGTKFLVWQN